MPRTALLACLLLTAWTTAPRLTADSAPRPTTDEVRLADGRVIYGSVRHPDADRVVVTTLDGVVRLRSTEVLRIRNDAELAAEIDGLQSRYQGAAHAQLELARLARRYRLVDRMWQHLAAAETGLPREGATRDRLEATLAGLGDELLTPHRRRAAPRFQAEELLRRAPRYEFPIKVEAARAVLAGLDRQAVGSETDPVTEMLLETARQGTLAAQRHLALQALQGRGVTGAEAFAWRTAVLDRDARLRHTVIAEARAAGRADAATAHLARGLEHANPTVMLRTADALAGLGSPAALAPLLAAGPRAAAMPLPGGSTRGHVAFTRQQAYVRDFDVEVAASSFIADPQIDVLQSGVVLDVTVHAVNTVRMQVVGGLRRSIRTLTGDDPGADTSTWASWQPAPREAGSDD